MAKNYFVTGIGTNVGKTFVSAVLTEALKADYWKPIQTGNVSDSDKDTVKNLITNTKTIIHPEAYSFKDPVSPHMAAAIENTPIIFENLYLPETENNLIIEGAGGILTPLNEHNYVIEMAHSLGAEIILVCNNYLGCINHSLLSIEYLIKNDFEVKGIVLNGNFDKLLRSAIINYCELPILAEMQNISNVSKESVLNLSNTINKQLFE
ncbi:MAG: dethiobiotin synthase [Bacteroidetes bacterium]|nr:dethiobiotin synthase [Bacteroidota bacterium]